MTNILKQTINLDFHILYKPIAVRSKKWMIRSVDFNDISDHEHGTLTDQGEMEDDVSENEDSDDLL